MPHTNEDNMSQTSSLLASLILKMNPRLHESSYMARYLASWCDKHVVAWVVDTFSLLLEDPRTSPVLTALFQTQKVQSDKMYLQNLPQQGVGRIPISRYKFFDGARRQGQPATRASRMRELKRRIERWGEFTYNEERRIDPEICTLVYALAALKVLLYDHEDIIFKSIDQLLDDTDVCKWYTDLCSNKITTSTAKELSLWQSFKVGQIHLNDFVENDANQMEDGSDEEPVIDSSDDSDDDDGDDDDDDDDDDGWGVDRGVVITTSPPVPVHLVLWLWEAALDGNEASIDFRQVAKLLVDIMSPSARSQCGVELIINHKKPDEGSDEKQGEIVINSSDEEDGSDLTGAVQRLNIRGQSRSASRGRNKSPRKTPDKPASRGRNNSPRKTPDKPASSARRVGKGKYRGARGGAPYQRRRTSASGESGEEFQEE